MSKYICIFPGCRTKASYCLKYSKIKTYCREHKTGNNIKRIGSKVYNNLCNITPVNKSHNLLKLSSHSIKNLKINILIKICRNYGIIIYKLIITYSTYGTPSLDYYGILKNPISIMNRIDYNKQFRKNINKTILLFGRY
jgi:hypothetical protein